MHVNLKPGGEITLADNKKYRIIDVIDLEGKKYIFCSTNKKPIIPIIFECREKDNNIQLKIEDDKIIVRKISKKVYENGMKEMEEEN